MGTSRHQFVPQLTTELSTPTLPGQRLPQTCHQRGDSCHPRRNLPGLPHALFLVPGYGAQGAGAEEALRGFVRGPGGVLEGGIVNSSRGLLFPKGSASEDAHVWKQAIDDDVERAVDELREAAR